MSTKTSETEKITALETAGTDRFDGFTDVLSFCPYCKNLQPLLFSQGKLVGEHKYRQENGHIYHDCGSDKPCHLYR